MLVARAAGDRCFHLRVKGKGSKDACEKQRS